MMQSWIRGIIAASVIAAVSGHLTPEGPVKKVTGFVCGVMLLAVLFSPLVDADRLVFSGAMAEYRRTVDRLTQDMAAQENRLLRVYIEERTAAYILDEAQKAGIEDPEVTVQVKWGDESWVPYEVFVRAELTEEQRRRLGSVLDAELGIPAARQHWNER